MLLEPFSPLNRPPRSPRAPVPAWGSMAGGIPHAGFLGPLKGSQETPSEKGWPRDSRLARKADFPLAPAPHL